MNKIDRYILAQLIGPFLFFCMVFTGIIWLNRALGIVDIVIENGQPASIFVELSALLLPKAIETSLPIAGFAAAVYTTNRLYSEAELVVIMNSGYSSFRLSKPYLVFGAVCMVVMLVLSHTISPLALNKLADRQDEIKRQFVTQIIKPGEFIERDNKFTFFFGSKSTNGAISEVMIEEKGEMNAAVIHTAAKGQVVTEGEQIKLVLFNGSILNIGPDGRNLSAIDFDTFAFDLSRFGGSIKKRVHSPRELTSSKLTQAMFLEPNGSDAFGKFKTEFHARNIKALLALMVCGLGMASLLVGGYNRSGFFYRIASGVLLMAALNSFREAMIDYVEDNSTLWFLAYLPVFFAVILVLGLLWLGSRNLKPVSQWFAQATNEAAQ